MIADAPHGRIRSTLGEHLVAVLIVAIVVLGALATVSTVEARTRDTATRAQERANLPLVVGASLDAEPVPSSSP